MRPSLIVLLSCVLIFFSAAVRAQMPVSPLSIGKTQIVRFAPALPSGGDTKEGSCWTESIAAPRAGAWRCSVGNAISDPCFAVAGNAEQLVCGADPALRTDGFILKLTKPLPKASHHDRKAEPWIFQLSDGSICEAMTGTLSPVNGEPGRWTCAIHVRDQVRPRGLVTALTPGKIWMADKFPESAIGTQGAVPEKIPVRMIWE
ncbi:MAG TPA: hypothetical protein VNU00_02745 [Candidatus Binataceae bacterium]|nr:hypothetical protein [Candidatus Binataceae bacterium]